MVNQLHGWTCPTCGTERSECDSGQGEAPFSGRVSLELPGGVIATFPDLETTKRCAGEGHSWVLPAPGDATERWHCRRCALAVALKPGAAA